MSGIATLYTLFASRDEAERIGTEMIEAGLAACVNILPECRSIYRWEGQVESSAETPALFKVAADRAQALVEAISARHSYEVPAIAVWPVALTTDSYGRWVMEQALDT